MLAMPAGWETSNPKDVKAFETGNLPAIRRILAKDNYIERDPRLLVFALDKAVASGNVELIRYLSDRGWLQTCRQAECYPVHIAASNGKIKAIEFLVTQGFDAKAIDDFNAQYGGNTPLHYAASFGHLETVRFLCGMGVDASLKNRMGETALDKAKYELDMHHGGSKKEEAATKERFRKTAEYLTDRVCTKK
jgi:hypothetical protein